VGSKDTRTPMLAVLLAAALNLAGDFLLVSRY
jgi:Na+-driven multidrug efflux pump